MAGEDFVQVKLSAAGEKMAGQGKTVRLIEGQCDFTFKVGTPLRVTRAFDWAKVLSSKKYEGEPIFELVAPGAAVAAAAPAPAKPAAPLPPPNHPSHIWPPETAAEEKS